MVVGVAVGTIIPTIMMAHIEKMKKKSAGAHARIRTISMTYEPPVIEPALRTRYTQASAVRPANENKIAMRSRLGSMEGEACCKITDPTWFVACLADNAVLIHMQFVELSVAFVQIEFDCAGGLRRSRTHLGHGVLESVREVNAGTMFVATVRIDNR